MQQQFNKRGLAVLAAVLFSLCPRDSVGQGTLNIRPEDDLVRRLAKETGGGAADCGRLLNPGTWARPAYTLPEIDRPISCVRAAAVDRKPAWFIFRGFTFDTWNAVGLFTAADGTLRFYRYSNYGGNGSFESSSCSSPVARVNVEGVPLLECEP